ncbi:hypothetical protein FKP32DRAFT_42234 [Trametes sanguinea]|nr:hypothetical protein FKP32DRAFT_42234 [Trametes sanguinea]
MLFPCRKPVQAHRTALYYVVTTLYPLPCPPSTSDAAQTRRDPLRVLADTSSATVKQIPRGGRRTAPRVLRADWRIVRNLSCLLEFGMNRRVTSTNLAFAVRVAVVAPGQRRGTRSREARGRARVSRTRARPAHLGDNARRARAPKPPAAIATYGTVAGSPPG